ncbi:hypothetical protein [Bradyrhizobium sp.]|uniref:hypothetical protein n=1 Tax=Bradyrhizobium sp. TaxID=376 RepID=UPI002622C371|nr:hypothetical protein [Bradyrhizobium sp.]
MQVRRRFKYTAPLKDRLTMWANDVRAQAAKLKPGPEQDTMLKRARQAETAAHIDDWVNSPGLQPPK